MCEVFPAALARKFSQPTVLCLSHPPRSALPCLQVLPCLLSRLQLPKVTAPSSRCRHPARHINTSIRKTITGFIMQDRCTE
jgi:hypothetical protein